MNSAITSPKSPARKRKKSRPKRNTSSWPVAFDRDELKMLKDLGAASGGKLSVGELARAAVRFAVPQFLSGEVAITERLILTKSGSSTHQPAE